MFNNNAPPTPTYDFTNVLNSLRLVDDKHTHIGEFIREKRRAIALSQMELAQSLGYGTPQFISNIERGIASIPRRSVKWFAHALKIDHKYLIEVIVEFERRKMLQEMLAEVE